MSAEKQRELKLEMYNALKGGAELINFINGNDRANFPIISNTDRGDKARILLGIDMKKFLSYVSELLNNNPDLKLNKFIVPYCEEDVEDGEGVESCEGDEGCKGAVNKENKPVAYIKFTTTDCIYHETHGMINASNIWTARFVISTTKNNN